MATERQSMRKTREILRQKWLLGCSNRAVAQSVGVSVGAGGETGFVDYAGKTPSLTAPATGERIPVELFLMALGASSYTYAEATASQQLADWIASHTRAFAFYGGVPRAVVPDQLRSAVTIP